MLISLVKPIYHPGRHCVIVLPLRLVAFATAVIVDQFAIDGLVNSAASAATGAGERARRAVDGNVKSYALWVGCGALVISALWMWSAN